MSIFGPEFEQVWPKAGNAFKLTEFGKNLLKKCECIEKPDGSKIDVKEFVKKSSNFPVEFGTNTCRVVSQPKERYPNIQKQIASAYPIIHERVLGLYLDFLEHKCLHGNQRELKVYTNMGITDLVQRLLAKRCVSFVGPQDRYLLLSLETGDGGFEKVGTDQEAYPLNLANVLSFDEIKLSALLSVSSHSEFLNDGDRLNGGRIVDDKSSIIPEGVVIGLIGGRFEHFDLMESQDALITPSQNVPQNGYGPKEPPLNCAQSYRQVWNNFYQESDFLYNDAQALIQKSKPPRFHENSECAFIFDNLLMKKRYAIIFDTLLLEAQARACAANKQAYVHVVGFGLGVWRVAAHQTDIFLLTFSERLKALLPQLPNVSAIHFSWFGKTECGDLKDNGLIESHAHNKKGIRTFLSNRNPAQKLPDEFSDCLMVVSYPWDGNALPGNEFWMGSLTATGDSSTACSTLITELHNPHINEAMVNGNNLHIATLEHGLMHIAEYSTKILKA